MLTIDVNGQYVHSHSLLEELKSSFSRVIALKSPASESEDLKSSISIFRISTPPQPVVPLAQTIKDLLLRSHENHDTPRIVVPPHSTQIESAIKSARGVEYMKPSSKRWKMPEVTLGLESPGVEYHQRVLPLGRLTVVWLQTSRPHQKWSISNDKVAPSFSLFDFRPPASHTSLVLTKVSAY